MPLFRTNRAPSADHDHPPGEAESSSEDYLNSPEDLVERSQRRRRLVILVLVILLAVGGGFAARPVLHVAKAWQARRTAAQAERLMAEHNWVEAKNKVQDALQIWRREPAAARAAALLLARVGNMREAAAFWKQVESARPLTQEENRDATEALLASGESDLATTHLRQAWPIGQEGSPADWMLGMQIAAKRNAASETAELARKLLASQQSSPRQRLGAAVALLSTRLPGAPAEALLEIRSLAQGQASAESLEALLILARWVSARQGAAAAEASGTALPALPELIDRIEAHPLAKLQHRLLAIDLRIGLEPSHRAAWLQSAADRFKETKDDTDLALLGAWFYSKGEFDRVLEVIPAARSTDDRALYFQRFDALAALNRWSEIREAIQSRKVAIDPMMEQMYLARCADKLGETRVRDARWDGALDAAGNNTEKLLQLGAYAAKNGQPVIAEKAFRAVLQTTPESREAYGGLLGLLESNGETSRLREVLDAVLKLWPQDPAARNDAAYLDALRGENLHAALETARQLVRAEPASVPHRVTLALAELRSGNALAALDAFQGIDVAHTALQPRQRAVYCAVLWATSYDREAHAVALDLPENALLPEEKRLVEPLREQATAR